MTAAMAEDKMVIFKSKSSAYCLRQNKIDLAPSGRCVEANFGSGSRILRLLSKMNGISSNCAFTLLLKTVGP